MVSLVFQPWRVFGAALLFPCAVSAFTLTQVGRLSPASYGLVFGDSDHDGSSEVALIWRDPNFNFSYRILERQSGDTYAEVYRGAPSYPRAMGDLDGDGKTDLVGQWSSQLQVYESSSPSDYPTALVWTYPVPNILTPAAIADTDRDGRMEIIYFKAAGLISTQLTIFENNGDNNYEVVYEFPTHGAGVPVIGDFDGDGLIEIAYCGVSSSTHTSIVTVVESPADNVWVPTFESPSGFLNGGAGQGGRDTDGNGKPELFFAGLTSDGSRDYRVGVVYEPCGDNCFQQVATVSFSDGSTGVARSSLGNIDGVGPEEFLMEGNTSIRVFRPVAPGQWVPVGQINDPNANGIHNNHFLFDANQNGIPELFWPTSASDAESTLIFEQVGVPTSTMAGPWTARPVLQVTPNPCRNRATLLAPDVAASVASIALYDVAGRLVDRQPAGRIPSGRFTWTSPTIAPGIYFFRLEDQQRTPLATARVTVVR